MSINLIRYAADDASEARWGVVHAERVLPLPDEYATTADVLGDGAKAARALLADGADQADGAGQAPPGVALASVRALPPVPNARVFCQGSNYRSHMIESGMDPDRAFNMLFTKSSASLCGAVDDIVRPAHVKLLDYEVELGIVLGRAVSGGVTVTADNLADYVGAFVLANDVSARDVQLPQGQWYKGKSYRTFTPVGPYLCIPDADEVARWGQLRLRLEVNGEPRQDAYASEMVFGPAATITEFSELEDLAVGDLIITGTPGGVALQPPKAAVQRIVGLLPEDKKWGLFVKTQSRSSSYLKPGDTVTASIRTDDGALDLGAQRNAVR